MDFTLLIRIVLLAMLVDVVALLLWTMPTTPAHAIFASKAARRLARAMRATTGDDWRVDSYHAYCRSLDLSVWHANGGSCFRVWIGPQGLHSGRAPLVEGGPDGELLYQAFRAVTRKPLADARAAILDKHLYVRAIENADVDGGDA